MRDRQIQMSPVRSSTYVGKGSAVGDAPSGTGKKMSLSNHILISYTISLSLYSI